MSDSETTPSPDGSPTLEDVAQRHADARAGKPGRPLAPPDPLRDAKREQDRVRKARQRAGAGPVPSESPVQTLFTPDSCRAIVRLPFDAAAVALNSKSWSLDEGEEKMVVGPCAETLNHWFPNTDQKWASLTMLALALFTITSRKYLAWSAEKAQNDERLIGAGEQ